MDELNIEQQAAPAVGQPAEQAAQGQTEAPQAGKPRRKYRGKTAAKGRKAQGKARTAKAAEQTAAQTAAGDKPQAEHEPAQPALPTKAAPPAQAKAQEQQKTTPETAPAAPQPQSTAAPQTDTAPPQAKPQEAPEPDEPEALAPEEPTPEEPEQEAPELVVPGTAPEPDEPDEPEQSKEPGQPEEPEKTEKAEKTEAPDEPENPNPPEPDKPAPEDAEADVDADPDTPYPVADEKRVADITRTVQLSIEQIMGGVADKEADAAEAAAQTAPQPDDYDDPNAPPERLSLAERVKETAAAGTVALLKWLALVLLFVLMIAGAGVAWLYRGATLDSVPAITVTFGGQTLEPTAYNWEVPVVSNFFKRSYAETLSPTAYVLPQKVEDSSPDLVVSPAEYTSQVTLYDAEQNELFTGNISEFNAYQLEGNGNYTAKLVISTGDAAATAGAEVTGEQTYQFAFEVNIRPSVRLSTQSITQGSILAVRVTGLLGEDPPQLTCDFENVGFVKGSTGWICYLPIPYDAEGGDTTLTVTAGGYTERIGLTVRPRNWVYKDYSYTSQLSSPYIGPDDTPAEVQNLLENCDPNIYWSENGFVQPFLSSITVTLPFGLTEYVGRTATQRAYNSGSGRTAINCVITTIYGDPLIAPCDGLILLAEDLGGAAGTTLVIDHGAGLKSIFYGLQDLAVEEGDYVVQGQTVGRTNRTTIAEMRIGKVPVEPLSIWRGQCDAIKIY